MLTTSYVLNIGISTHYKIYGYAGVRPKCENALSSHRRNSKPALSTRHPP